MRKRKSKDLCVTKGCRGKRTGDHGKKCSKCRSRAYYGKHPLRRLFHNLKTSARVRKKSFDLTYEEFCSLAVSSGYADGHGREAGGLHIDRKYPLLGYSLDNLQVLSCEENSAKGYVDRLRHIESRVVEEPF